MSSGISVRTFGNRFPHPSARRLRVAFPLSLDPPSLPNRGRQSLDSLQANILQGVAPKGTYASGRFDQLWTFPIPLRIAPGTMSKNVLRSGIIRPSRAKW